MATPYETAAGRSPDVQLVGAGIEPSRAFSYDAVEQTGKRKRPPVENKSEDLILPQGKRALALANARDLSRNFSIAAWAVRKHLDYVATFEFHGRSDNEDLNDAVEGFIERWSQPDQCDAAGRHSLDRFIRIAEGRAILDGDVGILKLASGQMQGIESDRIRDFGTANSEDWTHGVKVTKTGRALAYAIHRRRRSSLEYERTVSAANVCLHGYFDRFDQVRGISPIMSALDPLRDVYENFSYALAKSKVEQLFALAFYREADKSLLDPDEDATGRYKVDFGRGPVMLDLELGDRAEFLSSQNPSSQFQAFTMQVLTCALKALDIPFSFYDESHTNFFGSRGAWLHYERSCKPKRDAVRQLLQRLTIWRLSLAILDGDLELPRGTTLADIPFEWVPLGMPWWDPAKEINGDLAAIGAGLDEPYRVTKQRGKGDFNDNVRQIKKAMDFAAALGVPLSFNPIPQPIEVNNDNQNSGKQ